MGVAWLVWQSMVKNWFGAFEPLFRILIPGPEHEAARIGSVASSVRVLPDVSAATVTTVPHATENGVAPSIPARAAPVTRETAARAATTPMRKLCIVRLLRAVGRP